LNVEATMQHDNATRDDIAGVQAGIPLPIWNRNQGGIRRARAEIIAAESDVRRVELDLSRRLAAAFQRYQNANQQVQTYERDILPDAKASLDLVTAGYREGEFGYLALLTSQRTFFQTNLSYLEALRELKRQRALIDGLLLADSLSEAE
jgi:cobalt-zinc-cadmium efflux system outer membrane protein